MKEMVIILLTLMKHQDDPPGLDHHDCSQLWIPTSWFSAHCALLCVCVWKRTLTRQTMSCVHSLDCYCEASSSHAQTTFLSQSLLPFWTGNTVSNFYRSSPEGGFTSKLGSYNIISVMRVWSTARTTRGISEWSDASTSTTLARNAYASFYIIYINKKIAA